MYGDQRSLPRSIRRQPQVCISDRLGTAISRRRWVATLGSLGVLGVLALGLAGNTGALRELPLIHKSEPTRPS